MAKNNVRSPFTDAFPSKGLENMGGIGNLNSNPLMPSPGRTGNNPPVNFASDLNGTPADERTPFQDALNKAMKKGGAASFKSTALRSPFEDALAKTFKK